MAAEEQPPQQEPTVIERQGVVTDSIVAFSEGLGIGVGGIGAVKIIDAVTGSPPPADPPKEIVVPPTYEKRPK